MWFYNQILLLDWFDFHLISWAHLIWVFFFFFKRCFGFTTDINSVVKGVVFSYSLAYIMKIASIRKFRGFLIWQYWFCSSSIVQVCLISLLSVSSCLFVYLSIYFLFSLYLQLYSYTKTWIKNLCFCRKKLWIPEFSDMNFWVSELLDQRNKTK